MLRNRGKTGLTDKAHFGSYFKFCQMGARCQQRKHPADRRIRQKCRCERILLFFAPSFRLRIGTPQTGQRTGIGISVIVQKSDADRPAQKWIRRPVALVLFSLPGQYRLYDPRTRCITSRVSLRCPFSFQMGVRHDDRICLQFLYKLRFAIFVWNKPDQFVLY